MTTPEMGKHQAPEVMWPMDSPSHGHRKIVRVVWRVPELAEFWGKATVTEIYDMNDPAHRRMIDMNRFRLRCEIMSITSYDPAACAGASEEEIELDDEPLELSNFDGDDV